MTHLVFGAGSVGLGLASCLIKAGVHVTLVGRKVTVNALRREGLQRIGIFGETYAAPDTFSAVTDIAALCDPPEVVLVCTKAFDSDAAARALFNNSVFRDSSCPLILCQNGWGNTQVFAQFFDQRRIFNARIITGFERLRPHQVKITVHADDVHIGSLFHPDVSAVAALCQRISDGGIPAATTSDIGKDLWSKMLYNCCLNALGAILNASYGQLGDDIHTRAIMNEVAAEVFAVMHEIDHETHWADSKGFLTAFYNQMIPATYAHESSMLQDVRAGHRTEIDALNGVVARLAEEHGLHASTNATLANLIRFKEAKSVQTHPPDIAE